MSWVDRKGGREGVNFIFHFIIVIFYHRKVKKLSFGYFVHNSSQNGVLFGNALFHECLKAQHKAFCPWGGHNEITEIGGYFLGWGVGLFMDKK